jgi:hypothetical protein
VGALAAVDERREEDKGGDGFNKYQTAVNVRYIHLFRILLISPCVAIVHIRATLLVRTLALTTHTERPSIMYIFRRLCTLPPLFLPLFRVKITSLGQLIRKTMRIEEERRSI